MCSQPTALSPGPQGNCGRAVAWTRETFYPDAGSCSLLCEGRMQAALGVGSSCLVTHSIEYLVPLNIAGLPL